MQLTHKETEHLFLKADTVSINKNEMYTKTLSVFFIEVLLLLRQNVADDVSVDIRETEISALEAVDEFFVVNPEKV